MDRGWIVVDGLLMDCLNLWGSGGAPSSEGATVVGGAVGTSASPEEDEVVEAPQCAADAGAGA